jgi:flagellar hook-basal body complex protein FliE
VIVSGLGAVGHAASVLAPSQSSGPQQGASAGQGISLSESEGAAGTGPSGSFSNALTEAVSSLEQTQDSAASAAQSLATGTANDPESAVITVEDAQMAMELAAQIRTKATDAATNIFSTQV